LYADVTQIQRLAEEIGRTRVTVEGQSTVFLCRFVIVCHVQHITHSVVVHSLHFGWLFLQWICQYCFSGPEVIFKTCVAMKFVDNDDDDEGSKW